MIRHFLTVAKITTIFHCRNRFLHLYYLIDELEDGVRYGRFLRL